MEELNQVQTNADTGAESSETTSTGEENLFEGLTPETEENTESTPAEGSENKEGGENTASTGEGGAENGGETDKGGEGSEGGEAKPFLDVIYDKEPRHLSEDEAREYAQKGMNYDRVMEHYNSIKEPLERLAKLNGMDVNTYINKLNDFQFESKVEEEIESLKAQYPDYDEKVIREIAEARAKEKTNSIIQKIEEEKNSQNDAMQEAVRKDVETFQKEFPKVDLNTLPEEVLNSIREGHTLLSAYYKYLNAQNAKAKSEEEAKAKIAKQNEENKNKDLGNTSTAGGDEGGPEDSFYKAMDSI